MDVYHQPDVEQVDQCTLLTVKECSCRRLPYSMSMLIVDRHLLYPPLGAPQFKRFLDGSRLGTDRVAPATARQLMQLVWLGG